MTLEGSDPRIAHLHQVYCKITGLWTRECWSWWAWKYLLDFYLKTGRDEKQLEADVRFLVAYLQRGGASGRRNKLTSLRISKFLMADEFEITLEEARHDERVKARKPPKPEPVAVTRTVALGQTITVQDETDPALADPQNVKALCDEFFARLGVKRDRRQQQSGQKPA